MNNTPSIQELRQYFTNLPDQISVIYQPLYDTKTYPNAGIDYLSFFQTTKGGVTGGMEITNMEAAGQLPSPQNMLVRAIEVQLIGANLTDHQELYARGHFQFVVGSTTYLDEVGFGTFPNQNHVRADLAGQTAPPDENAFYEGRIFKIEPVALMPTMNFNFTVSFPNGIQPLSSGNDIQVRTRLIGHRFRPAQV